MTAEATGSPRRWAITVTAQSPGLSRDGEANRLRVGKWNVSEIFEPLKERLGTNGITIVLPGKDDPISVDVNPAFWKDCPTFRSPEIGNWLAERGECSWSTRRPPKYVAEVVVEANEVTLRILGRSDPAYS